MAQFARNLQSSDKHTDEHAGYREYVM